MDKKSYLPPEVLVPSDGKEVYHEPMIPYYPPPQEQEVWAHKGEYPPPGEHDINSARRPRTICGLRRATFWLLLVLAVVVLVAAVGGGVGGSIAVNNAKSKAVTAEANESPSGSTPTPTQSGDTSKTSSNPSTTGNADKSETLSPSSTSSSTSSSTTRSSSTSTSTATGIPLSPENVERIDISCAKQIVTAYDSESIFQCEEGFNIPRNDIMGIVAYTIQSCVDACTTYNKKAGQIDCMAVLLSANMADDHSTEGANCWLSSKFTTDSLKRKDNYTVASFDCMKDACPSSYFSS